MHMAACRKSEKGKAKQLEKELPWGTRCRPPFRNTAASSLPIKGGSADPLAALAEVSTLAVEALEAVPVADHHRRQRSPPTNVMKGEQGQLVLGYPAQSGALVAPANAASVSRSLTRALGLGHGDWRSSLVIFANHDTLPIVVRLSSICSSCSGLAGRRPGRPASAGSRWLPSHSSTG